MKVRSAWQMLGAGIVASAVLAGVGTTLVGQGRSPASIPGASSPSGQQFVDAHVANATAGVSALSGWTQLGPAGGSTSSLVIRPDNANILFVVSEMGALFKSTDAGLHWTFLVQLPMQHAKLEIAPDQPGTMYAFNSFYDDRTYPAMDAVPLKSTDGGQTWAPLQISATSPVHDYELYSINTLRTVPGKPGLLFAASESVGLIRSSDGGLNWTAMTDEYNQPFDKCSGLEIVAARSKVYSVCGLRPVAARLDGLGAVTRLMQDYIGDPGSGEWNGRTKIAVSKSNPDVVYVSGSRYDRGNPRLITEVFRSSNGGGTWTLQFQRGTGPYSGSMPDPFNTALPGDFEQDCNTPANYGPDGPFQEYQLEVDPTNPDVVWVAGREVYRSDDGGLTFGRAGVAEGFGETSLVFSPLYNGTTNQTLYTTGPAGIQRTTNARAGIQSYPASTCTAPGALPAVTWTKIQDGYSAAQLVHGLVGNANDPRLVVSEMNLGTLQRKSGAPYWTLVSPSVGQVTFAAATGLPATVIVSQDAHIERRTWNESLQGWDKSEHWFDGTTPDGNGFTRPRLTGDNISAYPLKYLTVDQVPQQSSGGSDPRHLRTATSAGVFDSVDGGATWQAFGPPFSVQKAWFRRDTTVLAWLGGNFVLNTPLGSGNWETRDADGCLIVPGHTCSAGRTEAQELVSSPQLSSATMYAVGTPPVGSGLPKIRWSKDGKVWQALDRSGQPGGLPDYVGMTALAVDPDNLDHLYAGTSRGLYRSTDNGKNWAPMDTPFPGTAVSRLMFKKDRPGDRRLYVFTFGRGAWMWQVPASTIFDDVPSYYWAHNDINKLYLAGITGGCASSPPSYCVGRIVWRDQMAVFLLRAMHGANYQPPPASGDFSDVPSSHWAAAWIEQLRDEGITGGCGTNPLRYCPGNGVYRDEMAVFLLRAKHGRNYQPPPATGVYADVPVNHWAAAWIEQLSREGIAGGCSTTANTYCPASPVSRDQMAAFLVRTFGL